MTDHAYPKVSSLCMSQRVCLRRSSANEVVVHGERIYNTRLKLSRDLSQIEPLPDIKEQRKPSIQPRTQNTQGPLNLLRNVEYIHSQHVFSKSSHLCIIHLKATQKRTRSKTSRWDKRNRTLHDTKNHVTEAPDGTNLPIHLQTVAKTFPFTRRKGLKTLK